MTLIHRKRRSKLIGSYFILICSIIFTFHSTSASENDNSSTEPGVILTQIIDPPKNTKVILGLTANLSCGVKNDAQTSVNLEWYFGRQAISKSTSGRIQILEDGTLKIEQARNTDVGVYNCTVSSDKGSDWKAARLDLIEIPHPPGNVRASLLPNSALVNVSYSAPFDGNSPIISYIVQKRIIPNYHESGNDAVVDVVPFTDVDLNITATQNFVIVGNLRPASTYQFRVIAVNSVGKGQPSNPTSPPVTLPAQPPSSPPIGVVGAARSSTTIYLQYSPPPTDGLNGQLRGYIVRFKLAGYHDIPWFTRNITNAGQLTYILEDLIVWKNYEIQVAAYNEVGVGTFSTSIYIRTKEGRPASAPSRVEAQAISATAIEVSWYGPDPQLINGINQGYKLRAFNTMDNTTKEIQIEPSSMPDNVQKAIIPNLEPFTEYLINVLCFTSAGDGPPNEPLISVKTQQGLPSEISSIKFFNVLDSSLDVEWTPPKKINGELVGFTLKFAALDKKGNLNQELKVQNFSESVLQAHITDLKPETLYRFEINAWTRVGAGDSKIASVKSGIPPVLPEPPIKLAISNIGPRSVVLQFTPGFNGNSTITKWLVESQLTKTKNGTWTLAYESINPTQLDAITVHNLKPYTGYRLRLIPVNIVGRSIRPSEPSPPFQTFQAPPSHPPINVTTQSFNPTTILVQWLPLVNEWWCGEPRGYNITWRELNDDPISNYNVHINYHVTESHHTGTYLITGLRNVTEYAIQVFAVNDVGSSNGSDIQIQRTSDKILAMPSNLELKTKFPFYFEKWFVSSVAGLMIMSTFLLIAGLCIHNSSYKYKHQQKHNHPHQQVISQDGISDDDHFGLEDNLENPYAAGFELRNNGQDMNNYRRANPINMATNMVATVKSPPRPAPGSLAYSDDDDLDDDTKENLYGSSAGSVTEKPSESSSQESESDEREEDDMAANHHFVNHYANVNDTLKKGHPSWKKAAHSYVVRSNHDIPHMAGQSNPYAPSTSHGGNLNNISHNSTSMMNGHHSNNNTNLLNGHSTHSTQLPPLPGPSHQQQHSNNHNNLGHSVGNLNMSTSMNTSNDLHPFNQPFNSSNQNFQTNSTTINNNNKHRISPPTISSQVPPAYNHAMLNNTSTTAADESDLDSPNVNLNLNGGRIVMSNTAGSRAPLPGFSSFV